MSEEHGDLHGAFLALSPLFPSLGPILNMEATSHLHTLALEALT